jgi:cytochrome c-type biogenesis protein
VEPSQINIGIAFIAGLASFLSPCVFSLVPAYIGYLGGRSAVTAQGTQNGRWVIISHALAFVLGFSAIFIGLGLAVSTLGQILFDLRPVLSRVGGVVVVLFGLHMTGIIRIPLLDYDLRPQSSPDRRWGYLSSFMMGVFFSFGWSPCIGPVLGAILSISLVEGSIGHGGLLLTAYSAGLAIPFLLAATQISLVTTILRRYSKVMHYVQIGMGVLLILIGIMLIQNKMTWFATLGSSIFGSVNETRVGLILLAAIFGLGLLGLIPAFIARNKGRDFVNWWFFGAGLFPIALPMSLKLKPDEEKQTGNDMNAVGRSHESTG